MPSVTREQLAAFIDRNVLGNTADPGAEGDTPWTREAIRRVSASGYMPVLADGDFHAHARVTRRSFYVIACRILADVEGGSRDAVFPTGFEWTRDGAQYVTGAEVVAIVGEITSSDQ